MARVRKAAKLLDEEVIATASELVTELLPLYATAAARSLADEANVLAQEVQQFRLDTKADIDCVVPPVAAILPFEVIEWEKLFWFLKFLIPKLKIKDPNQDELDELLEAVDLASYGLERTKLNSSIELDTAKTELAPQNPNPRGYRGDTPQEDPLEEIIRSFNERWFQGWSATPEEQRVKFLNIVESVKQHPDFDEKFSGNPDPYARDLAFEKIMKDVMLRRRKEELELYKLHSQDDAFRAALYRSVQDALSRNAGASERDSLPEPDVLPQKIVQTPKAAFAHFRGAGE
ncbi:hypothetical protein [Novosphingobium malaysiense]|uniref:Uncharacterized protein n=1 Tax=Novosphingobium malaysiense TaxID=1348853 RepID=A0A0B1ZIY1_9SPHN|nr:hypothetical protein [Novosphingobium malaysiense]KHK89312.1 hypothetical protein LK12_19380 [Novosphingobium malaysiense]